MFIKVTNGQEIAVAVNEAKKQNRPTYLVHMTYPTVMDAESRKGWEQYPALKCNPDGSFEMVKAKPKAG